MNQWKKISLLGIALLFITGCGGGKPEGIPALHPVTVTVTKGGTPVTKANIMLIPTTAAKGSWSVSGMTDASGVAIIETAQGSWKSQGAPEGEFQIYITKLAAIEEPEKPADIEGDPAAKEAYFAERLKRLEAAGKEIPKVLTEPKTSPLKITVASGTGASETFDVADYEK